MANLRRFEIDAIVDEIRSGIREHNTKLKGISEADANKLMNKQYPEYKKYLKLKNQFEKIKSELEESKKNISLQITGDRNTYNVDYTIEKKIKQIRTPKDFISISNNDIERKVIIESSDSDFKTIIESILKELTSK